MKAMHHRSRAWWTAALLVVCHACLALCWPVAAHARVAATPRPGGAQTAAGGSGAGSPEAGSSL